MLDIEPVTRTVTVGPPRVSTSPRSPPGRPVWTGCPPPDAPLDCLVQLRAHGETHPCTVAVDGDLLRIRLHQPARGVAKGQAAVLYASDAVLASATISRTSAPESSAAIPG